MQSEIVPYAGWNNNLRLSNGQLEAIVTLDVGPRIISLRTAAGENILKQFSEQLGYQSEMEWRIRGGHRFWLGPEDLELSYHQDNHPVFHQSSPDSGAITIDSVQTSPYNIRKTLTLGMPDSGPGMTVGHTAINEGSDPVTLATWGLTVMKPGGLEIIPQPPLGVHPRDLLPNRGIVLWPYTDLSDPRWQFCQKYFLLRQSEDGLPTKIGLAHRENWIGYVIEETLFIKTFDYVDGATYPDGGCNFETFTNSEMLEIESLGPLVTLAPGESVSHTENWHVFAITEPVHIESEDALQAWLQPYLEQAGL